MYNIWTDTYRISWFFFQFLWSRENKQIHRIFPHPPVLRLFPLYHPLPVWGDPYKPPKKCFFVKRFTKSKVTEKFFFVSSFISSCQLLVPFFFHEVIAEFVLPKKYLPELEKTYSMYIFNILCMRFSSILKCSEDTRILNSIF